MCINFNSQKGDLGIRDSPVRFRTVSIIPNTLPKGAEYELPECRFKRRARIYDTRST